MQHFGTKVEARLPRIAQDRFTIMEATMTKMDRENDAAAQIADEARTWAAERRFVPTRFGEIAYVERGRGEAALFLHGFPLHGFQWRGVVARLAGERRCIAPDLMGMGFTRPASGQGVSLPAQADMAAALLDRLGVESVDVVGNDSGTGIAQLLAVRHPGRVRSMLLTNGDVEPDTPPAALLPFIEMGKQGVLAERVLAPLLANKEAARSPTGVVGLTFTHPARLANADAEYRDTR